MISKPETSIIKFEEFFATVHKDDVFELLEHYPDKRSLIVDFNALEIFDLTLADLLIEKPEEVIEAAQNAIKNIDPLVKDVDINIRFENVTNKIDFPKIDSIHVGTLITTHCTIEKIYHPQPLLKKAIFECRGCMRLHEIEQNSGSNIIEPSLCGECGGRSFRLLQEESTYIESETAMVTTKTTNTKMELVLLDDLVDFDILKRGTELLLTGILKVYRGKNGFEKYILANNYEIINPEVNELISDDNEYNKKKSWLT